MCPMVTVLDSSDAEYFHLRKHFWTSGSISVVLNSGNFAPPPRKHLGNKVCLVGGRRCYWHLVGRGQGCWSILQCCGTDPQQRIILPKMLVVPRLRNPALDQSRQLQPHHSLLPLCTSCFSLLASFLHAKHSVLSSEPLLLLLPRTPFCGSVSHFFQVFASMSLREAFLHSLYKIATSSPPSLSFWFLSIEFPAIVYSFLYVYWLFPSTRIQAPKDLHLFPV